MTLHIDTTESTMMKPILPSMELEPRTCNVLVDRKVCKNVHNAKDASTHTAENVMLKFGEKNDASVLITISQVVLAQPTQKWESNH